MRRHGGSLAFALFVVVLITASVALMNTDVGRALYCAGKVDALDPWC